MNFFYSDDFYSVSRVTGPHHNLLQLRISESDQNIPICECPPSIGAYRHESLIEEELISQVIDGCAKANSQCGTQFAVTHIRYVKDDTGPEVIYGTLAFKIIERLARGGKFKSVIGQ